MRTGSLFIILVCLIWAGMVAAISFLEAPVKFTAPSLTLRVGLDVGRHVFAAFNKVELVWAGLLLILFFIGKLNTLIRIFLLGLFAIMALEHVWLLPVLDQRALIIVEGGWPQGTSPHKWYIIFEIAKFILLVTTAITLLTRFANTTNRSTTLTA
ncbi:MAG TPA: hypothetical protein VK177_09570 [Flavobacteriales bacterium]|nr:hypothetical protein [Flavobacteriales bacterium]